MSIGETGKPLFIRSKMLGISRTCSFELERTYMIILVTYCWPVTKEILRSNQSAHGLKSFPNVCDIDIEVSRNYSNERLLCSIRNQVLSTHRFRYPDRILNNFGGFLASRNTTLRGHGQRSATASADSARQQHRETIPGGHESWEAIGEFHCLGHV